MLDSTFTYAIKIDFCVVYGLLTVRYLRIFPILSFPAHEISYCRQWPCDVAQCDFLLSSAGFLYLIHAFSVTFENIATNHTLLKSRFFGLHFYSASALLAMQTAVIARARFCLSVRLSVRHIPMF